MLTNPEHSQVEIVRRLYEQALNQNQLELLPSLLNESVVLHGATEVQGIAAYRAMVDRLRLAFPDQFFKLQDLIVNDDRVVVRWTMDATHAGALAGIAATGKRVQQRAIVIYRFEAGKIQEAWVQMDQVGMLRQMGIEPLPGGSQSVVNQAGAR